MNGKDKVVKMKSDGLTRAWIIGVCCALLIGACADSESSTNNEANMDATVEGADSGDSQVTPVDGEDTPDSELPSGSEDGTVEETDGKDGGEDSNIGGETPSTGPCEFWFQDCTGGSICYPNGPLFECEEPTGDGEEADACENHTDCGFPGLLCSPDGCALACSIDELVEGDAPICVDNCQFGFEVLDLDLQLGYCLPDTTPGEWEQLQPETVKKEHVFKSIWMSGPNDIHLVGADGVAVHYQGSYWEVLTEGYWPNLNGVWGFAPDDVWAVGIGGAIVHYDGIKWSEPGECGSDSDCDDNDECTLDACDVDVGCLYTPTGAEGCCGDISYETGWDTGTLEGWVVTETYGNTDVSWNIFSHIGADGVARYTSPLSALYFGNPMTPCALNPSEVCPKFSTASGGVVGATVKSPSVTLPGSGKLVARFNAWVDTEAGNSYDAFSLWVSTPTGAESMVWEKIDTHASFEEIKADISQFAGQSVQFEFRFDSIDSIGNDTEGIYVDDFVVENPCLTTGSVEAPSFPTLFDIWGASPNDIYTVGLNGFVGHYDGVLWSEVDFSGVVGPWGFQGMFGFADSLHLVGDNGLIMKESGAGLVAEGAGSQSNLKKVWGKSPSDLYAVGENGTLLHNGGQGWTSETIGVINGLNGVWGAGSFEVVAVGDAGTILRKLDGLWTQETSGTSFALNDVWGSGSKNTWAAGESGTIVKFDGSSWNSENTNSLQSLNSIYGSSSEDIWAVGLGGSILHYDGFQWSDVSSIITQEWFDVWAPGDGTAILVGDLGLLIRGDGVTWSEMSHPMGSEAIQTIWGRSPTDIYAAGDGFILHYDGNEAGVWTLYSSTVELGTWRGICGSSADNMLVVGSLGRVIRWNGKSWGKVPVEPETAATADAPAEYYKEQLHGCWAVDKDIAWAVGEGGLILELVEGEFKKSENLIPVSLRDVFAFSKDLVFAVGIEGVILSSRGIGSTWLPIYSGTVAGLFGIFGTTLEDITVAGDLGTIQRFIPFYDALGTSAPTVVEEAEEGEEESREEDTP